MSKLTSIIAIFFTLNVIAQDSLVKKVSVETIKSVCLDQFSSVYLIVNNNKVLKYDSLGNYQNEYLGANFSEIDLISVSNGVSVLLFNTQLQRYILLDRYLVEKHVGAINTAQVGFASLVALSSDNNLWIFDEVSFVLKKYSPDNNKIILNAYLNAQLPRGDYAFSQLFEYKNRLFMLDELNGVFVFDNMGNLELHLPIQTSFISVSGDFLYYTKLNRLMKYNIYDASEKKLEMLCNNYDAPKVLKGSSLTYVACGNELLILRGKP